MPTTRSQSFLSSFMDSKVMALSTRCWKSLRSTVTTLIPFFLNSSTSSPSRLRMSLVALTAASCVMSISSFCSAGVSLPIVPGETTVNSASEM